MKATFGAIGKNKVGFIHTYSLQCFMLIFFLTESIHCHLYLLPPLELSHHEQLW